MKIATRNLPPPVLESKTDNAPQFRTVLLPMPTNAYQQLSYRLLETTVKKTDTTVVFSDAYNVGKWQLFDVSAGFGFTMRDYNNLYISKDDEPQNATNKNDRVHVILGLHIYPWKIYKRDESFFFFGNHWRNIDNAVHRLSLYLGFDMVKPQDNFYLGISVDLIPGIKIITGPHLYRHTRYEILNNQVVNHAVGVEYAGIYTSLSLDPAIFVGIIKNLVNN